MSLLEEKNLRQVYKASKAIPLSPFNIFFPLLVTIIVCSAFFISDLNIINSYKKIEDLLSYLFSSLLTLLGFLIAGYTIFCTVTPLDLQIKMTEHKDKKTNMSFFKKIHFTFIRVFIYFLIFSFFLLIIFMFKGLNFSFGMNERELSSIYLSVNYICLSFLIYGATFLFCELSSFIFNIYTTIVQTLQWEIDKKKKPQNEAFKASNRH